MFKTENFEFVDEKKRQIFKIIHRVSGRVTNKARKRTKETEATKPSKHALSRSRYSVDFVRCHNPKLERPFGRRPASTAKVSRVRRLGIRIDRDLARGR
jgi:hypothetical protein